MIDKDREYYVNHPIFVKYKKRFDWLRLKRVRYLKKTFVNERIVEIPFVMQNLPLNRDLSVLDIGCSESALSIHLASIGYRVTGLDMRPFPYVHPSFRFVRADVMNMSFQDESFDVVTCISTLEHIGLGFYHDRQGFDDADSKAMKEIYRVLAKDGLLIISVPFGRYRQTPQQRIYDAVRLEDILADFIVEQKLFFADMPAQNMNYWQQIPELEAEHIDSPDGSTNCVCLVRAHKSAQ